MASEPFATLQRQPVCAFYFLQASTLLALWLAVKAGSGVDFFQLSEGLANTALQPSWMPRNIFLGLVSKWVYRPAAYGTIPLFFLASFVEASPHAAAWVVRLLCALAVTIFQLGDSCRTTSHRDYLMVYICWALVVGLNAQAVAYGLCVLYILGSGLSKVIIGGCRHWISPSTMRAILQTFAQKTPKQGGPILGFANRFICRSDLLCALLGLATLVFECMVAPSAFFLPLPWRFPVVGMGMIILHLGIGAVQSGAIGAFFLPNVAAYVVGFGDFGPAEHSTVWSDCSPTNLDMFSPGWYLAMAVCFLPLLAASLRPTRLIPEDWPWTPFALFPWNAAQWRFLHDSFVTGDTRLVVLSECPSKPELKGLRVIPIEHRSDVPLMQRSIRPQNEEAVLYDLWSRTLGITTYQDELLVGALRNRFYGQLAQPLLEGGVPQSGEAARLYALKSIVDLTSKFLIETQRVVELSTGMPLTQCCLVRVNSSNEVLEVII
ncbi:unnamed protein product, partial [Symbiodinium pilosum]